MQNGRINSPKLRPFLSSSKNQNRKTCPHAYRERERGVDKNKNTDIAASCDLL